MESINIYEAKTQLSRLVERAARGEDIVIGKAGTPMVRLVPYVADVPIKRAPGGWAGRVVIHPDFDDLPPEIEAAFLGELD